MPLSDKDKSKLEGLVTQTNRKAPDAIAGSNAHFYFVCDKSLEHCVILIGPEADIMKVGRRALLTIKKLGKPLYSQGRVGKHSSKMALQIQKGNAKPTMLKKALKNPDNLIGSLPGSLGTTSKSWKIMMFSQDPQPDSPEPGVNADEVADFRSRNAEDAEGLSDEEIQEIMVTMRDYEANIPDQDAESQLLEEEQLAMEDEVRELDALEERIRKEDPNDLDQKRAMEEDLAERRIQLSVHRGGVGASIATTIGQSISTDLMQALNASLFKQLQDLLRQVLEISSQITTMQAELENSSPSPDAREKLESNLSQFKSDMQANLNAIQSMLETQSGD